ncbi:MBG domain-containing protein [Pediococcus damnosus]|uniref:MBG domain-containing protein n=1 Tax=Pediococcus damnosus TaxID=51663 RepID=UPI0007050364|nr:MBG domain-containing protein [Pediococcus damnosus]
MCMKNEKVHYKMYKAGRRWLVAGLTTMVIFVGGGTVMADTVSSVNQDSNTSKTESSVTKGSSESVADSRTSSVHTQKGSTEADSTNESTIKTSNKTFKNEDEKSQKIINQKSTTKSTKNVDSSDLASNKKLTSQNAGSTSTVKATGQNSSVNQESSNSVVAKVNSVQSVANTVKKDPSNSTENGNAQGTGTNKSLNSAVQQNQKFDAATVKSVSNVKTDDTTGVTDPQITVDNDELWSGLSSMHVDLALNYTDTTNVPKGTIIILHFTNPNVIDWENLKTISLPKYLTQTVNATTGSISLVYNNDILDQSGKLGISYTVPVINTGETYVDASLITPDKQVIDFNVPQTAISVNKMASETSSITTYWPGGANYGVTGAATLLNNTNTPQPENDPTVDSYGNKNNIVSVGSFTEDGTTLPAMIDLNFNWTGDIYSQLKQISSADTMSQYINADGSINYSSTDPDDLGLFAIVLKVSGNLDLTTDDIQLYMPETNKNVTDDYYVESLGSGIFGIMLKANSEISSVAANYPHTVVYLTPKVTGPLAEATVPSSTSSIFTNVIWYPSDAPTKYVQDQTLLEPVWSPDAYSTSFVPKISGFSDQTITAGQPITQATILRGVTANDVEDGDLTSKLKVIDFGGLDLNNPVAGEYTVEISVEDSDGNIVQASAKITVPSLKTFVITEKFQDTNGSTISPDVVVDMQEGAYQQFSAPIINGYSFVSVDNNPDIVAVANETLIFTYKKISENGTATLSGEDSKIYDGKVGQINPNKYVITLSNGERYQLTANDLQFVEANPTAVGSYHVALSQQGLTDLNNVDQNYIYSTDSVTGQGQHQIIPAAVQATLSGKDSKIYDGKVGQINPNKYEITLSNGESYQLTASDLRFVEANPTAVGSYHVVLSQQGLTDLNNVDQNYIYSTDSVTGQGQYQITPAAVQATLSGKDSKIYDGKIGQINPNKYVITLSNGESYQLTAADLRFVEANPTAVGSYHVALSQQGLTDLNNVDQNYVYKADSVTGQGQYQITPVVVQATLSGKDSKIYDGKVGQINPNKYVITLSNGESYQLTANDLQFVEVNPTAVGNYHVMLSQQGLIDLNNVDHNYVYTRNSVIGQGSYEIISNHSGNNGKPAIKPGKINDNKKVNTAVSNFSNIHQNIYNKMLPNGMVKQGESVSIGIKKTSKQLTGKAKHLSVKTLSKRNVKLPQTDEANDSILAVIGLAILTSFVKGSLKM